MSDCLTLYLLDHKACIAGAESTEIPDTNTGKTPCKYGPVFALYLHNWTLYGINTVQKRVCIYMAFFLCNMMSGANKHIFRLLAIGPQHFSAPHVNYGF